VLHADKLASSSRATSLLNQNQINPFGWLIIQLGLETERGGGRGMVPAKKPGRWFTGF
jgi:hypothetical protein